MGTSNVEGWMRTSYSDGSPTETDRLYSPTFIISNLNQACPTLNQKQYIYGACGGWSFRGNIPGVLHQERRMCNITTYQCK